MECKSCLGGWGEKSPGVFYVTFQASHRDFVVLVDGPPGMKECKD